jgi:hypothetical protein
MKVNQDKEASPKGKKKRMIKVHTKIIVQTVNGAKARPRYKLTDPTAPNCDAFMIAGSNLKHDIQGVFAREAIPMKGNRKLFEYTSEHKYGATNSEQVQRYLAYKSDNKYLVHIGNVVVDATNNVNSYCNHVQELLTHNIPFNCKYVKSGNIINIVQISPIAKNEELNIQYSRDGSYWKNRVNGYPEEILKKARKYYKISEPAKISRTEDTDDMPTYQSIPHTPTTMYVLQAMFHCHLQTTPKPLHRTLCLLLSSAVDKYCIVIHFIV